MELILTRQEVEQLLIEQVNKQFAGYGFNQCLLGERYSTDFCKIYKDEAEQKPAP